ncbi:MAG: family 16 glycoside hydrolase, partial [Candidatus Hydrogenedentales bacterium]
MKPLVTLLLAHLLCFSAIGQTISVDPFKRVGRVDPLLYGQFLEHIYESVVDGLWGQVVRGPSFEEAPQTLGPEWRQPKGNWRFEGDELLSEASGADAQLTTGDPAWTDYVFSVEARKDKGSEGFLIIFRAKDDKNFYWWNLGGWGNAYSGVEHEVDGGRSLVEGTRTETRIETGRWYQIEVAVSGKKVTCSLDGAILASFDTTTNLNGCVGLGSWTTDVRYRHARVVAGETALFEMKGIEPGANTLSRNWRLEPSGAPVRATWSNDRPLNSAYSQHIVADAAGGGIAQDGICVEAGVKYIGSVWLRGKGDLTVGLRAGDEWQEQNFPVAADAWSELPLTFVPDVSSDAATLAITLDGAGDIYVDQCTLHRSDTPYRPALYEYVKGIRPTFIRWPGGCYAEHYRWKDGIGAHADRITKPNYTWGGLDPNSYGTLEFLEMCEDLSCEPVIVLNIGQHDDPGKAGDYVQEALDWFDYCNGDSQTEFGALRAVHGHPEPFHVTYWEIGNETWRLGAKAYAERMKPFVDALRARDPNVKILACGSGGHNLEWNKEVIDYAAESMDFLSVHQYMEGAFEREMEDGVAYPAFLEQTAALIAASKNPKMKIAVTEWNQQSICLRTGLYAGLVLNGFERNGDAVTMSCPALFIRNVDASEWNNAFINHDGCRAFAAPNYLVMKLYRDNFAPVRVECKSPDSLNVVATWDSESDDVILKVVNPSASDDVTATIAIKGRNTI